MARFILGYRCYNFTNKNPVIDKVRTVLQDEGLYSKKKRSLLHQLTGVSVSTYDGWFEGDTRSPRHETVGATLAALGYEEKFVKAKELDYDKELTVAKAWLKKRTAEKEKAEGSSKTNGSGAPKAKKKRGGK